MAVKTFQPNFTNGEISPLMEGRIDFAKYFNSAHCMENFLVYPHGPATFRPGFRFIKGTKTNSTASRLIPFIFAEDDAFALEFGANYIRFYKTRAQIVKAYAAWATTTFYKVGSLVTNSGNYYRCLIAHKSGTFATDLSNGKWAATAGATDLAYEVYSPYAASDVDKIKFCQSCDVLYLFHPEYAPRKLMRVADDDWYLQTINFRPPPLIAAVHKLNATLTPAATTGDDIVFTAGSAVFLAGDAGRTITSGTGRAIINTVTSTTEVICDIIDDFASTDAIASGSWSLSGPAIACLIPSDSPAVGSRFTLTVTADTGEDNQWIQCGSPDNYYWLHSDSGTDEYYIRFADKPPSKPSQVRVGSTAASTEGTKGSLTAGQWDWAQASTTDEPPVNFNTLYVRLTVSLDPDSQQGIWRSTSTVLKDVFRSDDVGKYISIFGGIVKIITINSAQQIIVEVMKEMDYDSVYFDDDSDGDLDIQSTFDWTLYDSMWSATNGYPSCGVFYEDRLNTAGVPAYPETICGTVSGDYENYALGVEDDDAYSFTLNGRTVSYVRWLDPREFLIAGAIGSEWRIGPEDTTKALTPTNVLAKQQTNYGCADIDPLAIGHSTLFVQSALRKIREFTLDSTSINNDYVAPDLTMLAEHVTEGKIAGMCYQQEPLSIVWVWMKDGTLASMTYQRDEDVIGWDRHPIDGVVESLIALPGDQYDEVYAVIKRTINGATVRYIEVLEKVFNDDNDTFQSNYGENAFFVDSGVTQSGWNETTSYYLKITTGTDYDAGETLTVTATGHAPFSAGSVGKIYRTRIDDDVVDITITAYTSTSVVSGTCTSAIPTGLQNTNTYDWALLATAITGLSHLEGEEVAILADGTVRTSQTVSSGQVTISAAASIIHTGLAYTGKLTTVRPELSLRDGTSQGRTKRIVSLVIRVNNSATFKAGRDETNLDEYGFITYDQELYQTIFANSDTPLGTPAALFTGDKPCPFDGEFNKDARLTIIQDKPLPLTIVAIMADVEVTE